MADIDTLAVLETIQGEDTATLQARLAWYQSFLTAEGVSEDEKVWANDRIKLCNEELAKRQ